MEGELSIPGNLSSSHLKLKFGHLLSYKDAIAKNPGGETDSDLDFESLSEMVTDIFINSYRTKYKDTVYLESMCYDVLNTLERNSSISCIFIKCNGLSWSKLEHLLKYYPNTEHMIIVSNYMFGPNDDGLSFISSHSKKLRNFLLFTQSRISQKIFDLWSKSVPSDGIHIYHCTTEDLHLHNKNP